MTRLRPVDPSSVDTGTQALLARVEERLGFLPKFILVLANSPAALAGYMAFAGALERNSKLPTALRHQVELMISERHGCDYGVASYAAVAKAAGLSNEQIADGRRGHSPDRKAEIAMAFCREVLESRGRVGRASLDKLRRQGIEEAQVVELVSLCSLTHFTNGLNHVNDTQLDFQIPGGLPPF